MKMHQTLPFSSRRGSIILAVVIFGVIFAMIIASIARLALTERRLAHSDFLYNESRFAAQSVLSHGMAQVQTRLELTPFPPLDLFDPAAVNGRPIRLHPLFVDHFQNATDSRITWQVYQTNSRTSVLGEIGTGQNQIAFDPNAFANNPQRFDTGLIAYLRPNAVGSTESAKMIQLSPDLLIPGDMSELDARLREVVVYAKATTRSASMGERTSYAKQTFQVIDRSLYRYAVFFDGDLEFFPGAAMAVAGGPIHTNRNLYLGANPILRVHSQTTTAGDFFLRHHPGRSNTESSINSVMLRNFNINSDPTITNINNQPYLTSPQHNGQRLDSRLTDFRSLASQRFNGGLLTQEHGVSQIMPAGFDELRTLFGNVDDNQMHRLIAPVDISSIETFSDSEMTAEELEERRRFLTEIERQKWSYQSDLVFQLIPPDPEVPGSRESVRLISFQRDLNGNINTSGGQPLYDVIAESGDPGFEFVEPETYDFGWDQEWLSWNDLSTLERLSGLYSQDDDGNALNLSGERIENPNREEIVRSGIFDFRQARNNANDARGQINVMRFNMEGFTQFAQARQLDFEGVYFELPQNHAAASADGMVVPAASNWAVQIHNARTVPTGRYKASYPDGMPDPGLTFATNGALYVQGSFNDPHNGGDLTTPGGDPNNFGVPNVVDGDGNPVPQEMPVSLVADAVTILSNAWDNRLSRRTGTSNSSDRRATNTTVSAAIVSGNVPTVAAGGSNYSGGLENFPRFLEAWSGRDLVIRGSMINLYRSESFDAPWQFGGNIYTAPNRLWGYHSGFQSQPPRPFRGVTSYRRIYFQEMTAGDFYREIAEADNGNNI